ncbi:hypothetical protein HK100_011769 [Physocladia obscura]|uniref:Uncharacterized protein n=1 Tax=Physocladia obscura TaxID=109957 RepID=A0AAD5XHT9_9FUNG|nr:hypothetical protein HK100_011769 [Physocladia obscura]
MSRPGADGAHEKISEDTVAAEEKAIAFLRDLNRKLFTGVLKTHQFYIGAALGATTECIFIVGLTHAVSSLPATIHMYLAKIAVICVSLCLIAATICCATGSMKYAVPHPAPLAFQINGGFFGAVFFLTKEIIFFMPYAMVVDTNTWRMVICATVLSGLMIIVLAFSVYPQWVYRHGFVQDILGEEELAMLSILDSVDSQLVPMTISHILIQNT